MTTLESKVVKRGRDYLVWRTVSGDLSYSYSVVYQGQRFTISKLSDVSKVLALIKKHGRRKAGDVWQKKTWSSGYRFYSLKGREAKKFAKSRYAYGDYVEKLRKKR